MNGFCGAHPHSTWCYGNVYDAEDRPLNWWLSPG
jgi:hypothetical protein